MNSINIIAALGEDTTLLLQPDAWLAERRKQLQQDLQLALEDAKKITKAEEIKHRLQHHNLVAIQHTRRDPPHDEVIEVMPVAEAVQVLREEAHFVDKKIHRRHLKQISTWKSEGYAI